MQKYVIILMVCLFGTALTAQTTKTAREVGLQFNSLSFNGDNSFSAFYKKEIKPNVYRRFRFVAGNIDFGADANDNSFFDFNAAIAIGREKRKQLDRKLMFYRGFEFVGSAGLRDINETSSANFGLSFGLVFGLQHNFNEFWSVNIETIPSVGFNINSIEESTSGGFSANLNNLVSIGLVRRF